MKDWEYRKGYIMKKKKNGEHFSFDVISALVDGVSENDFRKLLADLQTEINDCRSNLTNYDALLTEVSEKKLVDNIQDWQENFKSQVSAADTVLEENYKKIEDLFNMIFADWDEYQKRNGLLKEKGDTNE